jgi:hypothetical protein
MPWSASRYDRSGCGGSFFYMLVAFVVAQRVVVRSSGVQYSDFLKNDRAVFLA